MNIVDVTWFILAAVVFTLGISALTIHTISSIVGKNKLYQPLLRILVRQTFCWYLFMLIFEEVLRSNGY